MIFKILSIKSWLQRQEKHRHCTRAVTGLAADAKNEMELLSTQTPVLQMSSCDLAITITRNLLAYICLFLQFLFAQW